MTPLGKPLTTAPGLWDSLIPEGCSSTRPPQRGDPGKYRLPTPRVEGAPYDFSFSGLKTAVLNLLHNAAQKGETVDVDSLAASFQRTICRNLIEHLEKAALRLGYETIVGAGGVCANSGLRKQLEEMASRHGWKLVPASLDPCAGTTPP